MGLLTPPAPAGLTELATAFQNIPYNRSIYLYKNENGVVMANTLEDYSNNNNFGYEYNFINGERIYTSIPITNYFNIQFNHPYTELTSVNSELFTSHLTLWLDAHDERTISVEKQKWISKGYNGEIQMIENTTSNSFTYTSNTIDLSTQANIESPTSLPIQSYFKLGMVITIPTQNVSNKTIFQHNRFSIRITQQACVLDSTLKYMIGTFDNGTFLRGITFKPSDATFKYFIYADNVSVLIVSGNTSVHTNTGSFYQNTSQKIFIGQDNTGNNNSQIKIHELLYNQSANNDLNITSTVMYQYLSTKWSLSNYLDNFNVNPVQPLFSSVSSIQPYYRLVADDLAIGNMSTWNNTNAVSTDIATTITGQCVVSVIAGMNNKNRVYFNGGSALSLPPVSGLFTNAYTVFFLWDFPSPHNGARPLDKTASDNNARPFIFEPYWNGASEVSSYYIKSASGLQGVIGKTYTFASPGNLALYIARYNPSGGICSFKINSSSWTTATGQTIEVDAGGALNIGCGHNGSNFTTMYLYSLAMYPSYLSDADVSTIITQINSYYNLNLS